MCCAALRCAVLCCAAAVRCDVAWSTPEGSSSFRALLRRAQALTRGANPLSVPRVLVSTHLCCPFEVVQERTVASDGSIRLWLLLSKTRKSLGPTLVTACACQNKPGTC